MSFWHLSVTCYCDSSISLFKRSIYGVKALFVIVLVDGSSHLLNILKIFAQHFFTQRIKFLLFNSSFCKVLPNFVMFDTSLKKRIFDLLNILSVGIYFYRDFNIRLFALSITELSSEAR